MIIVGDRLNASLNVWLQISKAGKLVLLRFSLYNSSADSAVLKELWNLKLSLLDDYKNMRVMGKSDLKNKWIYLGKKKINQQQYETKHKTTSPQNAQSRQTNYINSGTMARNRNVIALGSYRGIHSLDLWHLFRLTGHLLCIISQGPQLTHVLGFCHLEMVTWRDPNIKGALRAWIAEKDLTLGLWSHERLHASSVWMWLKAD